MRHRSVWASIRARTRSGGRSRAAATRATWYRAASGLMCGSRPLPEAVTRSTGAGLSGVAPRASARSATFLRRSGFFGPRFEPPAASAL